MKRMILLSAFGLGMMLPLPARAFDPSVLPPEVRQVCDFCGGVQPPANNDRPDGSVPTPPEPPAPPEPPRT